MDPKRFDGLARTLAKRNGRRTFLLGLLGVAAATVAPTPVAPAAFPNNCRSFVISGGPKRNKKLDDVDDDLRIGLCTSGACDRRSDYQFFFVDANGGVNGGNSFDPISPIAVPQRARVGDWLWIEVENVQEPDCGVDAIWLHCKGADADRYRGQKLVPAYDCRQSEGQDEGLVFVRERVRIRA